MKLNKLQSLGVEEKGGGRGASKHELVRSKLPQTQIKLQSNSSLSLCLSDLPIRMTQILPFSVNFASKERKYYFR